MAVRFGALIVAAAMLGAISAPWHAAFADAAQSRENQLKAAYLLNFVKFVEWPASALAAQVLTVCFVAAQDIYAVFSTGIEDKRVGGRQLAAREVTVEEETASCNVLYVGSTDLRALELIFQRPKQSVLSVSDARNFARNGGMIEFFTDKNRLKFMINVDTARGAGLRIGSALLQLATVIDKES